MANPVINQTAANKLQEKVRLVNVSATCVDKPTKENPDPSFHTSRSGHIFVPGTISLSFNGVDYIVPLLAEDGKTPGSIICSREAAQHLRHKSWSMDHMHRTLEIEELPEDQRNPYASADHVVKIRAQEEEIANLKNKIQEQAQSQETERLKSENARLLKELSEAQAQAAKGRR